MRAGSAIRDKVRAAQPLTRDDGVALFAQPNLMEVGALANEVRERLHGDRTYFNRNLHINATNVCVASCMFCSFARLKEGDPGAYTMSHEEAWAKLRAPIVSERALRLGDNARNPAMTRKEAAILIRGAGLTPCERLAVPGDAGGTLLEEVTS